MWPAGGNDSGLLGGGMGYSCVIAPVAVAFDRDDEGGEVAVKLIEDTEEGGESPDWLAKQLARAARRVQHTVPPWELWLLTLSFYGDRVANAEDRYDDLEALCGLLIEASIAVDDWEWTPE